MTVIQIIEVEVIGLHQYLLTSDTVLQEIKSRPDDVGRR